MWMWIPRKQMWSTEWKCQSWVDEPKTMAVFISWDRPDLTEFTASYSFTDLHRSSQIFTVSQLHWRKAWWKSDRKIQKNIEKLCLKFQKLKTLKIMKNQSTFSGWHHSPLAAPLKYLPLSLSLSLSESAWCTETVAHPRHRRNSARDLKSSTWILQEFLPWSWNSMEFRQSSRAAP